MAARISRIGLMVFRKLLGAYSLRKTAMVKPIGRATAMAIMEVRKVPETSGKMPKCLSSNKGVHCVSKRKSAKDTFLKKTEDSEINTQRIPAVVRMLTAAHNSSTPSMIFSLTVIAYISPYPDTV